MGFIATFTFALSIGIVFQCQPIYGTFPNKIIYLFNTNVQIGDWNDIPDKCGNQTPGIVTSGAVNILADILLLLFVIPRIRKNHSTALKPFN